MAATAKTELPRERARSGSRKAGKNDDQLRASQAGLDLLRVLGWMVVHDVVVPGAAGRVVDHVAAGPSGVYVVNTVTTPGALTARDDALLAGGVSMAAELADVAAAAEDLRALLRGHPVAPMLCFVRGEEFTAFVAGAAVCSTENVLDVLTSQQARFDGAAQAAVTRTLTAALVAADSPRSSPPTPAAPEEASGKHRHAVRFPRFGRGASVPDVPEKGPENKPEKKPEKPVAPAAPVAKAPAPPVAKAPAAPAKPELKAAELKAAELKAAELKAAELKAAELKAAELKAAELKAAELKAAEQTAAEQTAAEQKAAEQKAAELKAAEQKAAHDEAVLREALEMAAKTEQERAALAAERARIEAERRTAEAERKQAEEARARIEDERKAAEAERARIEAERHEAEQARAQVEAERRTTAEERARIEAERKAAEAERARIEAERARADAERQQADAERQQAAKELAEVQAAKEMVEAQAREAVEQRKRAALDEQRTITEERRAAAEERARAAEELAAAHAEQERIAAERKRVVEERRLAEEAEARAVAERKRAAAERRAAEVAQERAEQERAVAERRRADREARERHLAERAAADVAAQRGEPVEEVVAQVLPPSGGGAPVPSRFAAPPVVARPPEPVQADAPGRRGGFAAAMKIVLVAALVVGVVAGVGPRAGDILAWGQGLLGARTAAAYGEQVVAEANAYHPELTLMLGKPAPAQVTAGQVAKGNRAFAVPLRIVNGGSERWLLRAGSAVVAVDSLGVEHRLLRTVSGIKAGKVLAPQLRVAGGGDAAGLAVFAIPSGRTVSEVRVELSSIDDDTFVWKAD